ncbi:unnamed protein product [Ilex paraguariensis]|uniref:Uncharacterized protein n=1 Tax=Ilex paraguariensis TaxID=185542 RepID=A0ABC8S3Q5_9AQUA
MGFLHKLWDDTLAGPAPDTGLGKLRKYNSFSAARSSAPPSTVTPNETPITRSITLLRTTSAISAGSGSVPASPAGSSTTTSPFSPSTPRGDFKKFTRRKPTPEALQRAEPGGPPTGYDWIVMSALDR